MDLSTILLVAIQWIELLILLSKMLMELNLLRLQLENAQLKADAAIPADLKANIKAAGDAIAEFWKAVGINPVPSVIVRAFPVPPASTAFIV